MDPIIIPLPIDAAVKLAAEKSGNKIENCVSASLVTENTIACNKRMGIEIFGGQHWDIAFMTHDEFIYSMQTPGYNIQGGPRGNVRVFMDGKVEWD